MPRIVSPTHACPPRVLGSLYQSPRAEHEEFLFPLGLKSSLLWCSHHETIVWLQPELPGGLSAKLEQLGLASTYQGSGWCFAELVGSSIATKKKGGLLDLSMRGDARQYGGTYGGLGRARSTTILKCCEKKREPPVLPSDMKKQLETVKKFSNKGDVSNLQPLYPSPSWHIPPLCGMCWPTTSTGSGVRGGRDLSQPI